MNNYFDPFSMLVGPAPRVGQAPPGMMVYPQPWNPVPGLRPYPDQPPVSVVPGYPVPGGRAPGYPGGWAQGCGPCGPDLSWCEGQGPLFYRQAIKGAAASFGPQTALGLTSRVQPGVTTPIGAGLSRTLTASPTVPFCISRLITARTSAPFFGITSIKAARVEYLSDGEPIPADMFAADSALMPPMRMPMLYPGTTISVTVTNNDTADHHFDSSFVGFPGPSCEPCL
jgi:hypothetical protein